MSHVGSCRGLRSAIAGTAITDEMLSIYEGGSSISVMRFDPFRDFDRLTEQMLGGRRGAEPRSFPMDAYRRGDRFFVHLDLPGVDPDSIELTCEQNVLTIRADRRFDQREDDDLIVF